MAIGTGPYIIVGFEIRRLLSLCDIELSCHGP